MSLWFRRSFTSELQNDTNVGTGTLVAGLFCLHFRWDFRLDETCQIERVIRLLLAAIDCHADTHINDLIAQNENGVLLGGIFSMYP